MSELRHDRERITGRTGSRRQPARFSSHPLPAAFLDAVAGGVVRDVVGVKSATPLANAITAVMDRGVVTGLIEAG